MKVISWHPVLTDHQSYTLEALQQAAKCILTVYVAKTEHPSRQMQGWVNLHAASLFPQLIPQKGWFKYIVRQLRMHPDAAHFFGSPFEQPRLIVTLLLAIAMGRRVFLISEPYSPISAGYQNDRHKLINRAKAVLRPILYRFYGMMLSRRLSGVFAISLLAVSQYRNIGIAKEKIFPFGYFVPRSERLCLKTLATDPKKPDLRLIFIGTLIERKGLDVLIEAVRSLNKNKLVVTLDVYGSGDSSQFDFDRSTVKYCGLIPFGESQAVIAQYDVLVLPSRYDGWGVVVNEALMAGVPVICSNRVGAGAVVEKWQCGVIFASEDVPDLACKLNDLVSAPESLAKMRLAARNAGEALDPGVAGRYMFDVLRDNLSNAMQSKSSCPWYEY
ncbi:MAG: glycosyltransferase [Methylobacter tundripaludum]|nr:glycosyltransferase [Methylobacter tundripaludum]